MKRVMEGWDEANARWMEWTPFVGPRSVRYHEPVLAEDVESWDEERGEWVPYQAQSLGDPKNLKLRTVFRTAKGKIFRCRIV